MDLQFNASIADNYKQASQKARILTENWATDNLYCPICGYYKLNKFKNNQPVADFFCPACKAQFELKSSGKGLRNKIVNGAYAAMITRILSDDNPHLLYMNYSLKPEIKLGSVHNLVFVPKYFFTPGIIEKRKPLSQNARRAGWIGCNILFNNIPEQGKIKIISDNKEHAKDDILMQSQFSENLNFGKTDKRTWIFEVLNIINSLKKDEFELKEVYAYKEKLSRIFPENHNIEAKIRQSLQILRDRGIITFEGRGCYRKLKP